MVSLAMTDSGDCMDREVKRLPATEEATVSPDEPTADLAARKAAVERFRGTYEFARVDHLFRTHFYFWPQTLERWRAEGLPDDYAATNLLGFDPDPRADTLVDLGWTRPPLCPEYERQVLAEDDDHLVERDRSGTVRKIRKTRHSGHEGMPQYLRGCVETRADWENDVKHRLLPDTEARWESFERDRERVRRQCANGEKLYTARMIGGYMYLRSLLEPTKLLYVVHDEPALVHDMMRTWLHLAVTALCRVQDVVPFFRLFLAEDICFKTGPLISPAMIRSFLLPYYRELFQTLQGRQPETLQFEIDSDGATYEVIEVYREIGVTAFSPFEVAAGCDVVAIGEKYPWLVMNGGIDKRILASGKEAIDREVERIIPVMVERGGYFPTCDHGIPEDVSLANYMHYRKRVQELDH